MAKPIEVLVVEDSPVALMFLVHILNSDPRLHVIGTAVSGEKALEFLRHHRPAVIVIDIHMAGIDGYETTRRIMEVQPVPVVICTASLNHADVNNTFRALEAGAVALVGKPVGLDHEEKESIAEKLIEKVVLMSEVRVVRRWPRVRSAVVPAPADFRAHLSSSLAPRVVAIGASTGGPPVLETILAGLPRDFGLPILIVQHIAAGFLPGLAEWLGSTTGFPIRIAAHGEPAQPGHAYLGPDHYHLGLGRHGQLALTRRTADEAACQSVAHLFRSVATVHGSRSVAVLLTGMGRDGADELKHLKDLGALTIAQDRESSVVHGMPGEAIRLGAARYVLSPEKIAGVLAGFAARPAAAPEQTSRE